MIVKWLWLEVKKPNCVCPISDNACHRQTEIGASLAQAQSRRNHSMSYSALQNMDSNNVIKHNINYARKIIYNKEFEYYYKGLLSQKAKYTIS